MGLSLTNLLLGKHYTGIEHFSIKNEEMTALLSIEKSKDELVIKQAAVVAYTDTFPEDWDKSYPVSLVITTNQVIQKEIALADPSDEKIIHKAFPNLQHDEFFYEIWRLKSRSIVAVSRKSYVNGLVADYQKQGVSIISVSLGIVSIAAMAGFSEERTLATNSHVVTLGEETAIAPKQDELSNTYSINGLEIQSSHLLAFAGILRLLISTPFTSGTIQDYNRVVYDDYNQKTFFSKGFKVIIGVLLVLLLANFFIFNHYYKKEQEISESLELSKSSLETITKAKDRIRIKEQKVKNVVELASSKSSQIINEITRIIPASILLTELAYHPLDKKIKVDEPIMTQESTIEISGTTVDNASLTNWIEKLGKLKWVGQTVITHFGKNELNETVFSLKLTLKK